MLIDGVAVWSLGDCLRYSAGVVSASSSWSQEVFLRKKSRNSGPSNHQWPKSSASYGAITIGLRPSAASRCFTWAWRLKRKFPACPATFSIASARRYGCFSCSSTSPVTLKYLSPMLRRTPSECRNGRMYGYSAS